MKPSKIITLILAVVTISVTAQKKNLTLEDCEMGYWKGLYPASLANIQWLPNNQQYSYMAYDGVNKENPIDTIYVKNAGKSKMAEYIITSADIKKTFPKSKRFNSINWVNSSSFYFSSGNKTLKFDFKTKTGEVLNDINPEAGDKDYHPEANLMAYTIDNNLYVDNGAKGDIVVFKSNDDNIVSGQAIHRSEFGIVKGTFWSPTGKGLAFYQKDESKVANYPLLDINETPGKLNFIKYPMAGQTSELGKVGVYRVAAKKTVFMKTGYTGKGDHYVTNVSWGPNEKFIYIAVVNRDQNHVWFNQYDALTGTKIKTIFEEESKEWTEPEHHAYFIPGKVDEFLWLSERDGFKNLYHYNTDGKLIKQVTQNKWVTKDIIGFSATGDKVFIEGTGADARENHTFSVDIASGKTTQLTKELGTHSTQLSADKLQMIDTWSNLSTPKQIDIVSLKKMKTSTIHSAINPLTNWNVGTTEFDTLKSEDGHDLYTRIIKPADFDASKKYPVLVYVYGGPHAQLITNSWLGGARLWMHYMASQGYIVYTLDNRGSAHRGYEFEKVIHRQLGTKEMEDQLVGVKYLKSLPYVDANRLAVHGWSFGGFMTTSLMTRYPGTFTTGVAGGPVIDWKWYEVMYGERYMDTPEQNPEGYKTASLMQYADKLEGELLMIHGTVDPVVVMQHNLAYVQASVSAGVQIDFFPYPMHEHNVSGPDRVHLMTKICNYIIENNK
jgi:dipeptidyl-peptidase-4